MELSGDFRGFFEELHILCYGQFEQFSITGPSHSNRLFSFLFFSWRFILFCPLPLKAETFFYFPGMGAGAHAGRAILSDLQCKVENEFHETCFPFRSSQKLARCRDAACNSSGGGGGGGAHQPIPKIPKLISFRKNIQRMVPQSQPQANQGRLVQGVGGFIFDLGVTFFYFVSNFR